MRLPDPHIPFILLDDARAIGAKPARLYTAPVEIIAAYAMEDVLPALAQLAQAQTRGLHAAGYLAYEAGFALEPRLARLSAAWDRTMPLLWFGLFDQWDSIASQDIPALLPPPATARIKPPAPLVTQTDYAQAFDMIRALIEDGDIYQANLTFRSALTLSGDPRALYAAIRPRAAAGYGGLVHTGDDWLLSFSPELFFTLKDGKLAARPMKGTAIRGADAAADEAAIRTLRDDPKQRAENLMIVDLLRNDLSRVAVAGSVKVPELFRIETYPTVHQMISAVEATIRPGLSAVDVLRAIFPCGSITGAPKLRAMEVIHQVESGPRGAYTGSIGRIDADGNAAFNVAIRTICVKEGRGQGHIGLGSGIVADSVMAAEWIECQDKGRFLDAG